MESVDLHVGRWRSLTRERYGQKGQVPRWWVGEWVGKAHIQTARIVVMTTIPTIALETFSMGSSEAGTLCLPDSATIINTSHGAAVGGGGAELKPLSPPCHKLMLGQLRDLTGQPPEIPSPQIKCMYLAGVSLMEEVGVPLIPSIIMIRKAAHIAVLSTMLPSQGAEEEGGEDTSPGLTQDFLGGQIF